MKKRYILRLIAAALLPLFSGCTDELDLADEPASGSDMAEGGLVFSIGSTRGFAGSHPSALSQSEEEIVINPDNFHVVLFSSKGEVKQIWANQELTEISEFDSSLGEIIKKYYVKIPRQDIDSEVVRIIRENSFKLAVFANWDGYPDFTTTKGGTIDANGIDHNDIYYISHCRVDNSYQSSGTDGQMNDSEVFSFITGKGSKMGIAQEWVCERFKNDDEADAEIRSRYSLENDGSGSLLCNKKPVITNSQNDGTVFNEMKDYTYNNLWEIWNFGGEKNLSATAFYNSSNQSLRDKWASINNDWYRKCFNDAYNPGNGNYTIYLPGETSCRGLTVKSPDWSTGNASTIVYSTTYGNSHGIVLRQTGRKDDETQTIDIADGSYLHYMVPADGYMYVKCRARDYGAKLVVRRGLLNSTGSNIYVNSTTLSQNSIQTVTYDYSQANNQIIRVTGEPSDLVLYAVNGDVEIYEIDYIKSRTLQTVDRQMINPASTPEGGISMYGIQDFDPVPLSVWPDGTTFNLSRYETTHTGSQAASYKYRTLYLLRSVAKVEVLIPTSMFPEPSHMFMRTINRFSRSAPLDVFTPTNIIWDGWSASSGYTSRSVSDGWDHTHNYYDAQGVDDEAENIRTKGFTYEYNNTDPADYRNAVAWLFGLWKTEYGWNWNNADITIKNSGPYPRVFNTRISRSDFAHMIDGGKVIADGQEYYYYYAYLPEKNVTDPNDKGTLGESPKVMRIEMRFDDRNTDTNLDDNASYRIYFTPGGKGNGINNRDDYDDNMEKGNSNSNSVPMQNLKNIYPVMRNHLYRFKVTGIEMNELNVEFQVQGPESRDIEYNFE